ncbi:MAG: fibro-slime domain-containing protein [Myxococcales bacterium]|nr:MAG: fibro-slime domain-containing protein [Myxococcales bacterium]
MLSGLLLLACGASEDGGSGVEAGKGGTQGNGPGPLELDDPPITEGPLETLQTTLPAGFVAATGAKGGGDASQLKGGWKVVGPLGELPEPSQMACANVLRVLMRDFATFKHPDFGGAKDPQNALGLVESALGPGRKPTRTAAYPQVASKLEDWYATIAGVSTAYVVDFWLEPVGKSFVLDSSRFFPLDSVASAESTQNDDDGQPRNFGFTTELHTSFRYAGGEIFTFRGDDDVFVFVDGKLVVDIGGVHGPTQGTVMIDQLGLAKGSVYTLDLFQAERNPTGSNFRIETTLDFADCGAIVTDVPR